MKVVIYEKKRVVAQPIRSFNEERVVLMHLVKLFKLGDFSRVLGLVWLSDP